MELKSDQVFYVSAMEWIAPSPNKHVSYCKSNRCLCCQVLNPDALFTSFSTGGKFMFNKTGYFSCKTRNVIYLISCKKCGIQYVGQTSQALHCRLNGHRSSINTASKNTYLATHFRENGHSVSDLSIQIIDVISEYEDKDDLISKLQEREDFFIKTMNTLYPLGLNDKLSGGAWFLRAQ